MILQSQTTSVMEFVFWLLAALIFYVYVGYPIVLVVLQGLFGKPAGKAECQPSVSILIPAFNEAEIMAAKIRNTLALDYPRELLEIVVASDGSTDGTADIAKAHVDGRVRFFDFPENRGKVAVLNDTVPHLRGEIVVFSDASAMLAPDSMRELVTAFSNPKVGAVSGVYGIANKAVANLGRQEDFYWSYETFLKTMESRLGTLTGAHGAFYAIRRSLYPFPLADTINDDFVIPTSVIRQGFRIAYETRARALEEAEYTEGFRRRVRITAGNFEQVGEIRKLLGPSQPLTLFCFLSHKAGRLLVPPAMVGLLACSLVLASIRPYSWFLIAQAVFYGVALIGAFVRLRPAVLRLPYYFCRINAAFFVWLYQVWFRGRAATASGSKRSPVAWT
jgi:hypothetical protein